MTAIPAGMPRAGFAQGRAYRGWVGLGRAGRAGEIQHELPICFYRVFCLHASLLTHLALGVLIDKTGPTLTGSMNVHHLELFYYVARHGGIMPAVRNIPYGIQQPAISSQMAQLEEYLGATLFQRRPFALTAEGEKLFQFIQPFFSRIDKIAVEL
jgi:hypothetical protein